MTTTIDGLPRYDYVVEDGLLHVKKTQDCEEIIRAIRSVERKHKNLRYEGSIPNVIALEWAKECGAPLFSKEWKEYAMRQMKSPNYKFLRPL